MNFCFVAINNYASQQLLLICWFKVIFPFCIWTILRRYNYLLDTTRCFFLSVGVLLILSVYKHDVTISMMRHSCISGMSDICWWTSCDTFRPGLFICVKARCLVCHTSMYFQEVISLVVYEDCHFHLWSQTLWPICFLDVHKHDKQTEIWFSFG